MAVKKSATETMEAKQAAEMKGQEESVEHAEEKEGQEESVEHAQEKEGQEESVEHVEEKKEPKRYMYVGPTVSGIGIQNRVYTDIPQEAADLMNSGHPVIGDLFIQIRDYPAANRMLHEKKGYLYNAYLAAEKIRIENVKKAEDTFTGGGETEERG